MEKQGFTDYGILYMNWNEWNNINEKYKKHIKIKTYIKRDGNNRYQIYQLYISRTNNSYIYIRKSKINSSLLQLLMITSKWKYNLTLIKILILYVTMNY